MRMVIAGGEEERVRFAVIIAAEKNVAVAIKDRLEPRDTPQRK